MTATPFQNGNPCPFCKKFEALEIKSVQVSGFTADVLPRHTYHIRCNVLLGGCGGSSGNRSNVHEAIEAWDGSGGPFVMADENLQTTRDSKVNCPTCDSPEPRLHPAVQSSGEVHVCKDAFHFSSSN